MSTTIWRGPLFYGFVVIPIRLTAAARRERTSFHYVSGLATQEKAAAATGSNLRAFPPEHPSFAEDLPLPDQVERVHYAFVGEQSNSLLAKERLLKGLQVGSGNRYLVFTPAELGSVRAPTSTQLDITEFVREDEVDPVFFDLSYYVSPDHGGEKSYSLLYHTLRDTGYAAMSEWVLNGREYPVVIRPGKCGLILHAMFFGHEVRAGEEFEADRGLVTDEELELSKKLVDAKRGAFNPANLRDKFGERLLQLVFNRSQTVFPASGIEAPRKAAPVFNIADANIADALRESLESVPKPLQREGCRSPRGRGRKRRQKE